MSIVDVQTSQNIEIRFTAASVMHRVAAVAIDFIVQIGAIFGMLLIYANDILDGPEAAVIIMTVIIFYPFIFESLMSGQTIGKRLLRIRVVSLDGSPASVAAYFFRWLLGLLEIVMTSGSLAFITVLVSKRSQRLGDIAAGTTVIKEQQAVTLDDLLLSVDAEANVSYPQVIMLTDNDVETIRQVLTARTSGLDEATLTDLLWKSAETLKTRLGTAGFSDPVVYLQDIMESYQVLHKEG